MPAAVERRRLLLAARRSELRELHNLFAAVPLERWDVLDADSFERARFLLQHNPCDVLLVDESLCHAAGSAGLSWLARQPEPPTVFLTSMEPDAIAQAYDQGVSMCVPRRMSLDNPQVLAAALGRTVQIGEMQHNQRRVADRLHQCRRQVDRLVNLLWRTVPMDSDRQWFTHRHVLERLQQEVARCGRHGSVFTVAVGEIQPEAMDKDGEDLTDWTSTMVSRAKRRCDVAGAYGLRGFMLLMVQTPKPGGVACCRRLQNHLQNAAPVSQKGGKLHLPDGPEGWFAQKGSDLAPPAEGPCGPIRASFGLSSFSPDNATMESLLSRAEKHLEAAKAGADGGIVAD